MVTMKVKRGTLARINTGKNTQFTFWYFLGYLKNTHKNPKFGNVRQFPTSILGICKIPMLGIIANLGIGTFENGTEKAGFSTFIWEFLGYFQQFKMFSHLHKPDRL